MNFVLRGVRFNLRGVKKKKEKKGKVLLKREER